MGAKGLSGDASTRVAAVGQVFRIGIRYAFLSRIPLLLGSTVFVLPFLAHGVLESMLRNLFAVNGFGLSLVTAMVLFGAWTIRILWRVLLLYGHVRYKDVEDLRRVKKYRPLRAFFWPVWILLPLPTLIALGSNTEGSLLWMLLGGYIGFCLIALYFYSTMAQKEELDWIFDSESLKRLFTLLGKMRVGTKSDRDGSKVPQNETARKVSIIDSEVDASGTLVFQVSTDVADQNSPITALYSVRFGPTGHNSADTDKATPGTTITGRVVIAAGQAQVKIDVPNFDDVTPEGSAAYTVELTDLSTNAKASGVVATGTIFDKRSATEMSRGLRNYGRWLPGYMPMNLAFGSFLFYYVLSGILAVKPFDWFDNIPPLFSLLTLLIIVGHIMTALTFFLDKFRVPVIVVMIFVSAIAYNVLDVDHYFELRQRTTPSERRNVGDTWIGLQEAIQIRLNAIEGQRTAIVVAASGGGIQSAAWTARVLTGLEALYGSAFADSIVLMSSVSGGSVGSMYYLDRLINAAHRDKKGGAFSAASDSSLEAIGWGFSYPDLARLTVIPYILVPKKVDRGWAIERVWRSQLMRNDTLSAWEKVIRNGGMPIPVFNCTVVETGERLLLTPVCVPPAQHTQDFFHLYEEGDIDVVTAARLSATFPYVTPVARALRSDWQEEDTNKGKSESPTYHIADGGYYDNFGVMTLVEWLNKYVLHETTTVRNVLLIQINLEPRKDDPVESSGAVAANDQKKSDGRGTGGWSGAYFGPLFTLLKVRQTTQKARNDLEIELLKNALELKHSDEQESPRRLAVTEFSFHGDSVLSWKLNRRQRCELLIAWQQMVKRHVEAIDVPSDMPFRSIETFFDRTGEMESLPEECLEDTN